MAIKKKSGALKLAGTRKSLKKVSGDYLKIGSEIWPMERHVLERPDRLQYVRKIIKPDGCVFCEVSKKPAPHAEGLLLYKSKHSMIVMNKYPYNNGHLLVLPLRHGGEFLGLSSEQHLDLHETLRKAIEALKTVYNPPGLNVGLNLGAVAGAGIPDHLHYHVIPRWAGDTNFFPLIAQSKAIVESLEQTFDRLLAYLHEGK